MPDSESVPMPSEDLNKPDYVALVRFMTEPLADSPDALKVDCERISKRDRALIRLAFDGGDRGRIFGRGGRNVQAIRTVLKATADLAGEFAHLEIFNDSPPSDSDRGGSRRSSQRGPSRHGAPKRRQS